MKYAIGLQGLFTDTTFIYFEHGTYSISWVIKHKMIVSFYDLDECKEIIQSLNIIGRNEWILVSQDEYVIMEMMNL